MKKNYKITPEGTRDLLFEECTAQKMVGSTIEDVFKTKGYHQVITPSLEFYDLFTLGSSGITQQNMFMLTDHKGRLMAIRPDSTLPIARMAATRLKTEKLPVRLYYNQRVYRNNSALNGRTNEVQQAGIELLGARGLRADLEVITTAIEALQQIVPDFRIELGHAGFFRALANQLDISDALREDIRVSIESKNYSALNEILDSLPQTDEVNAIRKLPRLFGGEEVLEEAALLVKGTEAESALAYLKTIYGALSTLNMGGKIIIDLGLVQRNDYYSDIVFSGYVEGSGDTILIGGRYDNLLQHFENPMPAAGFGLNVDALTKIVLSNCKQGEHKQVDVLVHGDDGYEMAAINQSRLFLHSGFTCEISVFSNREQATEYAKERGIKKVCFVNDNVQNIDI